MTDIDLDSLFAGVKPSVVTPHLAEVSGLNSNQKLRAIAKIIVKEMVTSYNKSPRAKIPKVIVHDGQPREVRYLNIDPLLTGVWPSVSLMLLQLSYGEQAILIESLYPKQTQFTAKAFASIFTPETGKNQPNLTVKSDPEIVEKLDSANAGIALILAELETQGYRKPHPDYIDRNLKQMRQLVKDARKISKGEKARMRAKEANQFRDQKRL